MRKTIGFFALVLVALFSIAGCGQQQAAVPTIPEAIMASSVAALGMYGASADDSVSGGTGMQSAGIKAAGYSTPEVGADGWWQMSYDLSYLNYTYDMTFNFKIWDNDGNAVTSDTALDNLGSSSLGSIWIYGVLNISYAGTTYQINIGSSKSNPFKCEGYNAASLIISGPVSYASSYAGISYAVTATYNNLTVSTGGIEGYPTGTVDVSVAEGGTTVCTGTITFDGDKTATLAFTSGYSGTYTINLEEGTVTAAAL